MVLCFSLVSSELGPKLVGSETCNTDENGQSFIGLAKIQWDQTVGGPVISGSTTNEIVHPLLVNRYRLGHRWVP